MIMKQKLTIIFGLVLLSNVLFAQKKIIDTSAIKRWTSLGYDAALSNDGKYVYYTIENQPLGGHTLFIKTSTGKLLRKIINGTAARFGDRNNTLFYMLNDSLIIDNLVNASKKIYKEVESFQLFTQENKAWVAIQLKNPKRQLLFVSLDSKLEKQYSGISGFNISPNGSRIVLKAPLGENKEQLIVLDLKLDKQTKIWEGYGAKKLTFDKSCDQLVFLQKSAANQEANVIGYYKFGVEHAIDLIKNGSSPQDGLVVSDNPGYGEWGFSTDGSRLFFSLEYNNKKAKPLNRVSVDIWSSQDSIIQSQQLVNLKQAKTYNAVIDLKSKEVMRLVADNEQQKLVSSAGNYLIVERMSGDINEDSWNKKFRVEKYLVFTKTGKRILLTADSVDNTSQWSFSPGEKYIIYCKGSAKIDYYSYEISTQIKRNMTADIVTDWATSYSSNNGWSVLASGAIGHCGWLKQDQALLIQDRFDIWQVDPSCRIPAVNITNGIGRKRGIIFCPISKDMWNNRVYDFNEKVLLKAFNVESKESGFFKTSLGRKPHVEELTMQPALFDSSLERPLLYSSLVFKAKGADKYLFYKQSETQSLNLYTSTDFKSFTKISENNPNENYNWYTTELHNWKSLSGDSLQGVLYKPENFDPNKKYPVIFNYYYVDEFSNNLHVFHIPELSSSGNVNIPYYTSNGYLVFTPDIKTGLMSIDRKARMKESTVNAVISAVDYLSKLKWVDEKKMALSGHSYGGGQTLWLITSSNLFAAAVAGAPPTDRAYFARNLGFGGVSSSFKGIEMAFMNGKSLYKDPQAYFQDSPINYVDKVNTPLLMMHNIGDKNVDFVEGIQFFTGLRRNDKKAWLLQYDGESHGIHDQKAMEDFTIRMKQFFDHYLKNAPMPRWMSKGIPASMKGIDDGLALDTSSKTLAN